MELIELRKVFDNVFRKAAHSLAPVNPRAWIARPDRFHLAIRCCDGSFHVVNSDISDVVKGGIARNDIKLAIGALSPVDPIHGQRYVIFDDFENSRVFLLGTVENAIMMIAGA